MLYLVGVALWAFGGSGVVIAAFMMLFGGSEFDIPSGRQKVNRGLVLAAVAMAALVGAPFVHANVETGTGTETGFVTSIQDKGAIWPTPDVFFKTALENSETYQYCLSPEDAHGVRATLTDAQERRQMVRITYAERAWWHPWDCNDGPMIVGVEVL